MAWHEKKGIALLHLTYIDVLLGAEVDQNIPPCNIPLWQKNYFELKAVESEQIQEDFSTLPLSAQKQGINFPLRKVSVPYTRERRAIFII